MTETDDRVSISAHGLTFQLPARRMRGGLVVGGHPLRWFLPAVQLPAVVLLAGVILVPVGMTLGDSLIQRPQTACWSAGTLAAVALIVGMPALRRFPFVRTGMSMALLTAAVLLLPRIHHAFPSHGSPAQAFHSLVRTLIWVLFAFAILALGFVIAWHTRLSRRSWLPTIAPFAVSALASGAAFRLIFYRIVRLGTDHNLGIVWLHVALIGLLASAFAWIWLGFVTALLRTAIHAIVNDPVRNDHLMNGGGWWITRMVELLGPVLLIVGLAITVAAARVFDLVLIGVPASVQRSYDTSTVYWWRLATAHPTDDPTIPAYTLPTAVIVVSLTLILHSLARGSRSRRAPMLLLTIGGDPSGRTMANPGRGLAYWLGCGLMMAPIVVLGYVSLHRPDAAWWRLSWDSPSRMWSSPELWRAMWTTAWVAGVATVIVLTASAPVAFRLAAPTRGPARRFATRIAYGAVVILAVLPVQVYLGPIHTRIANLALAGTMIPLTLVHAAAGLPVAVLILRNALLTAASGTAADTLYGLATTATTVRRVIGTAGPAFGAVAVLEFIQVWNDFVVGLLTAGPGDNALSQLFWGQARQFSYDAGDFATGILLSGVVPVLLLLLTWRRWVVPGITGGVLK